MGRSTQSLPPRASGKKTGGRSRFNFTSACLPVCPPESRKVASRKTRVLAAAVAPAATSREFRCVPRQVERQAPGAVVAVQSLLQHPSWRDQPRTGEPVYLGTERLDALGRAISSGVHDLPIPPCEQRSGSVFRRPAGLAVS